MVELLKSKETGQAAPSITTRAPSNVVNIMEALRRSLQADEALESKKVESKKSLSKASGSGAAAKPDPKTKPAKRKAG